MVGLGERLELAERDVTAAIKVGGLEVRVEVFLRGGATRVRVHEVLELGHIDRARIVRVVVQEPRVDGSQR